MGLPGSNTVFLPGNVNATRVVTVAFTGTGLVTNIQGAMVGIATGPWTFTATAVSSGGIESSNAVPVSAMIRPGKPQNLNIP